MRWEQFCCCLLWVLANGLGSKLEVAQCTAAWETLKATAVTSTPQHLTRLLWIFFNAVLDAEVPLTGQHQHPCDKLCICSRSSCSYSGRISELRLHIDEVGQAQPYTELCWSPWAYIWAEFALLIEVSSVSCVVAARTGKNLCWSVKLSLQSLSRMWWHSPQDTTSCLVPLHAAVSSSRPGCVSVADKWFPFTTEPNSTFSCHEHVWERAVPRCCPGERSCREFLCQQYLQRLPQEPSMPLGAVLCRSESVSACRRMPCPPLPCSHPRVVRGRSSTVFLGCGQRVRWSLLKMNPNTLC